MMFCDNLKVSSIDLIYSPSPQISNTICAYGMLLSFISGNSSDSYLLDNDLEVKELIVDINYFGTRSHTPDRSKLLLSLDMWYLITDVVRIVSSNICLTTSYVTNTSKPKSYYRPYKGRVKKLNTSV